MSLKPGTTRLKKNSVYFENSEWVVEQLQKEIQGGLKILKEAKNPLITFFGSHKVEKDDFYYGHSERLAFELGKLGFGAVTGGGPGIMLAANEGARKAGVPSIGLRAGLLHKERVDNIVFTESYSFYFLFARRFLLSIKSEALIFYPGGYGTLNEIFEYVTLMQTGIVDEVPIVCVGREYWSGLICWIKEKVQKEGYLIRGKQDVELIHVVDTVEEVMKIVGE